MTLFIDCNNYLQSETLLKPRDDVAWDVMSRRGQQYVPLYLCSPVPMFPEPMFPGTYVPRYRCSPNLCSPVPMFPGTYVPRTYVPRFTANMLDVVIGIGIPSELFDKQFRCVNGRAYITETPTHTRTHAHTLYKKKWRSVHRAKCAIFRWHPALLKTGAEHCYNHINLQRQKD